jgi:poly-gamma-glutamate capsule biosynthesis protein CapA/YwtB (metallophosphatase superfamily)
VSERARWLLCLACSCLLLVGVVGCLSRGAVDTLTSVDEYSTPTSSFTTAPCLGVQRDLWEEEEEFFLALAEQHSDCTPGPVGSRAEALDALGASSSSLAIVSGPSPGHGAELLRAEPFVLACHVACPLEDVSLEWLRGVFSEGGEYRPVIVGDGQSARELLGIEQISSEAIHVSSWEEANSVVSNDRWVLALLPWEQMNFHLHVVAIDAQSIGTGVWEDYPHRRLWWLVGDVEGNENLVQDIGEGLALEVERPVSLVAVGDVMLGRAVGQLIEDSSPSYPFLATADLISQADVAFANLEGPITSRGYPQGGISLRASPSAAEGLAYAGFDVVSLANNHVLDYGEVGLPDTMEILEKMGILYTGVARDPAEAPAPAIVDVGGVRLAFLAYNHVGPPRDVSAGGVSGPAFLEPERVYADVRRAAEQADLVIVSLHWGAEYVPLPDDFQQEVAEGLLEAGAHLILGHHPHVMGGVGFYEQGFVAYSLGNFVFDQPFSLETERGLLLHALLDASGLKQVHLVPVQLERGQPSVLPAPEARLVLSDLWEISRGAGLPWPGAKGAEQPAVSFEGLRREWTTSLDGPVRALRVGDLDGDGVSEILAAAGSPGGSGRIYALNGDGTVRWVYETPQQVNGVEWGDLDGDGRAEVVSALGLLDAPGEIVALDAGGGVRWRYAVEAAVLDVALGNLDADPSLEVGAGEWGAFGDTVYVLNGDGSLLWKRPTSGSVHSVWVGDLDNDGGGEVIAGAEEAYAWRADGSQLWRRQTGAYVDQVCVGNIGHEGSEWILAATGYAYASASALDPEGRLAWEYDPEASPTSMLVLDADRDGRDEVLAASCDGTISLVDRSGSAVWTCRPGGPVNDLALADVNGDGVLEAVVGTGDYFCSGGVYVLDIGNGGVLAWYEGPDAVTVVEALGVDGDQIVVGTSVGEVFLLNGTSH